MKLNLCVLALAGVASATSVPAPKSPVAPPIGGAAAAASPVAAAGAAATGGAVASANPDNAPANDAPSANSGVMGANTNNTTVSAVTEAANAANNDKETTKKDEPTPDPEKAGTAVTTMSLGTLLAVYFAL